MNKFLSSYERLFVIKLLGVYLISSFAMPFIESIHFMMHLGDGTEFHTYHSHNETHTHASLNLVGKFINNQSSEDTSNKTESVVEIKKNIQYHELENPIFFLPTTKSAIEFVYISNYQSPYFFSKAPPPKSKLSI